MGDISKLADWALDIANKGGALSSSALLFMYTAYREYCYYLWKKQSSIEAIKRLEAWQDNSKAEEHQTSALGKMSDRIEMNTNAINAMSSQLAIMVALEKDRRGIP